jgi:hypothetical protein
MIVDGKIRQPPIRLENRELPDDSAQLLIGLTGVDPAGEGHGAQCRLRLEQLGEHDQPVEISRLR